MASKKITHHKCRTLREFKKVCRKYLRHTLPLHMRKGKVWHQQYDKCHNTPMDVFVYDVIRDLPSLSEPEFVAYADRMDTYYSHRDKCWKTDYNNLHYVRQDVVDNYGEYFAYYGCIKVRLVGLSISESDYYYVYEYVDKNHGDLLFDTAVNGLLEKYKIED